MNAREMFEKLGYILKDPDNDSVEEYFRSETKNNPGILFGKTFEIDKLSGCVTVYHCGIFETDIECLKLPELQAVNARLRELEFEV